MDIKYILEGINADVLGGLCGKAGIGSTGRKLELIDRLFAYYNKPGWAKEVYEQLKSFEQDLITCVVSYSYNPPDEEIQKVCDKHKRQFNEYKTIKEQFVDSKSKLNLYYVGYKVIPAFVRVELNKFIKPVDVVINAEDDINLDDYQFKIVGRDERVGDFDEFIKYFNTHKVKATKAKCEIPKAHAIKLYETLKYDEIFRTLNNSLDEVRTVDALTITKYIMDLLVNANLIKVNKEYFIVNPDITEYQKANKLEKVRMLLNAYLEDNGFINEINRINSNHFRMEFYPDFSEVRKMLLEYLKVCPINKWINITSLSKWIKVKENRFLRPFTGRVLEKDEYYNAYYYETSHDTLEGQYIGIFLEYLATLGIIDCTYINYEADFTYNDCYTVNNFKITSFGANALGLTNDYKEMEVNNKIHVTEDFKIIVNDSLQHELYFDRFLNKIDNNTYELNFKGMAKALELGIDFAEIYNYLKENNDGDLPKEIKFKFQSWIDDSHKIKIKTVTILELDDLEFEEITNNPTYNECIDDVKNVIILKDNKINKMKEKLNKNERFWV